MLFRPLVLGERLFAATVRQFIAFTVGVLVISFMHQIAGASASSTIVEIRMLKRIYSSASVPRELFAPNGLGEGRFYGQLRALVDDAHHRFGAMKAITEIRPHFYRIRLEHGTVYSKIAIDEAGEVALFTISEDSREDAL